MKFALASDVHLEFGPLEIRNTEAADVLVLSGDICVIDDLQLPDERHFNDNAASKSNQFYAFFEQCAQEFKHVVYVLGNHEHYHGDFATSVTKLKACLGYITNLHVLDKEHVVLEGVIFFGATLWTDMNRGDPLTMQDVARRMNDFRTVNNSNTVVNYRRAVPLNKPVGMTDAEWIQLPDDQRVRYETATRPGKFTPMDAVEDHAAAMLALNALLDTVEHKTPVVVCTHHAPSKLSTHPRYAREVTLNGGYSSDLSEFILDNPQIMYWTHGHTHEPFEYQIGLTTIVCNPRGYIHHEELADYFSLKYYTV